VPVLFATDRKRDSKQKAIAFGSERDSQISLGLADVTIPEETKGRSEQQPAEHKPAPAGKKEGAASETGSERRLAMRCIQIVKDAQIIELASRRLAVSKTYPNQVLVFVHGYNVSFDNAVRRAAQIAYDLKFDGGTFLFSWPSRGQWDPRAYFSDSDTVDIAAEHLRQFLETIVAKTKTPRINFIAHSMGNLVLLRALDKIGSEYPDLRKAVGEIIDAAPDVDTDVFKQLVPKVIAMGGRFTLYASANDRALWLSGLLRNGSRAGFISANRPLIVAGVDTIDISQAGTGLFALNHDVYTASPSIIEDMRRVFELGTRPPDQRTKDFEKMTSKDGAYWRLKASVPTAQ
jgi:esterase/lipase superfamily enzyme